MSTSVLIADAQRLFADALAEALAGCDGLVVRAERPQSARELAEALAAGEPDVALVDYYLDARPAGDLVAAMAEHSPEVKVVFLSWLHQPEGVEAVLEAGAVGYLPKSCGVDQVGEALATLGGQALSGGVDGAALADSVDGLVRLERAAAPSATAEWRPSRSRRRIGGWGTARWRTCWPSG